VVVLNKHQLNWKEVKESLINQKTWKSAASKQVQSELEDLSKLLYNCHFLETGVKNKTNQERRIKMEQIKTNKDTVHCTVSVHLHFFFIRTSKF